MFPPTTGLFSDIGDIYTLLHRLMFASNTDSWINTTTVHTFTTVSIIIHQHCAMYIPIKTQAPSVHNSVGVHWYIQTDDKWSSMLCWSSVYL